MFHMFFAGDRNMFVLTEGGKLRFMKKFDFNPSCFLPYASKSSFETLSFRNKADYNYFDEDLYRTNVVIYCLQKLLIS